MKKHKPFKKRPSTPRKPRPPSGPARAGFTYGYQWGAYQPPELLKFPIEDQGFRLYPVMDAKRGTVTVLTMKEDGNPYHYIPISPLEAAGREHLHHPAFDITRIAVALDWHVESGYDVDPYHHSGRSWGAVKFMRENSGGSPLGWMDTLVDYWRRILNDGTRAQWSKAPSSVWWLDTELRHPDDWHDLRERLWPLHYAEDIQQRLDEEDAVAHSADPEPDIDGGDIATEDHRRWYQYGRLYFEGDEDGLERLMVRDNFFPNVWSISDHGNAHLVDVPGEALRLRQERLRG